MTKFNFDEIVPRRNTASVKWDLFEEDTLPLWVADMDFKASPAILDALQKRLDHGVFGYELVPQSYFDAISSSETADDIRDNRRRSIKPFEGIQETTATDLTNKVNHSSVCVADVTTIPVCKGVEGKRRMTVVMEGAQGFVSVDMQAKAFCYILDRCAFETRDLMLFNHDWPPFLTLRKVFLSIISMTRSFFQRLIKTLSGVTFPCFSMRRLSCSRVKVSVN